MSLNEEIGLYVYANARLLYLLNDSESIEAHTLDGRVSSHDFEYHLVQNKNEIKNLIDILEECNIRILNQIEKLDD